MKSNCGNLSDRFTYLSEFEERKAAILSAIAEQGKQTNELKVEIEDCLQKTELEDLYLPSLSRCRLGEIRTIADPLCRGARRISTDFCPDFFIELRSWKDGLQPLQTKMQEYLNSGLRLGWLIDLQQRQVEIYRPDQAVEIVPFPARLLGEEILPGFTLELLLVNLKQS